MNEIKEKNYTDEDVKKTVTKLLKNISTEKINPFKNKLENEKSRGLGRC